MMNASRQNLATILENGLSLHRKGQLDKAKTLYLKVLESWHKHPQALYLLGVLEYENERLDRVIELMLAAIEADPNQADFYVALGQVYHKKGQPDKALACFKKAIAINPALHTAYLNLAAVRLEAGQTVEAVASLKQALLKVPDFMDAHLMLGRIYLKQVQLNEAVACFESALCIDPDGGESCFYLGVALQHLGNVHAALDWFQKAIDCNPGLSEAHLNMGLIYAQLGNINAAALSYSRALENEPEMPEALNNMGNLKMSMGQLPEAIDWYKRAVQGYPQFREAHLNLANCHRKRTQYHQALECYEQMLTRFPDTDQVLNGMGAVYKDLRRPEKAISCFRKALALNPASSDACSNMANVYNDLGLIEKARTWMDKKSSIQPEFADAVKKAMMLPLIYESTAAIDICRKTFEADLDRLRKNSSIIKDPYRKVGVTNFILALHGKNEKPIREKIARFYLDVCPDLQWTSPLLNTRQSGRKIKIGMVSKYFYNNTIGSLYHGLIEKLSKEKFSLILFRFPGQEDRLSRSMHAVADTVVRLPQDIRKARERIAEERLDVLFYPELGMDALTYFVAFSRLAPVQCKRGFQITMGIPNIDYFISSDAAEPPDAQQHYSEKLIRLKGTGYYNYRPERPNQSAHRATFGLPEKRNLYICPQSLFKFHPDFDPVLAALLKRDPNGVLVLLEGLYPQWKTCLLNRLAKSIADAAERICFVPRQPRETFLNLYLLADAVIDTMHFSGGHTSLECFAWGIPVVTWPSSLLPGRLTYGFYRQMGVMDCVACDQTTYVDIAHRLANDLDWRAKVSRKILERSDILFENKNDVMELERFFEGAVRSAYSGNAISSS
jgi:predicted O-linked N-acetylglucosamine transferase (SPINDLY family)